MIIESAIYDSSFSIENSGFGTQIVRIIMKWVLGEVQLYEHTVWLITGRLDQLMSNFWVHFDVCPTYWKINCQD